MTTLCYTYYAHLMSSNNSVSVGFSQQLILNIIIRLVTYTQIVIFGIWLNFNTMYTGILKHGTNIVVIEWVWEHRKFVNVKVMKSVTTTTTTNVDLTIVLFLWQVIIVWIKWSWKINVFTGWHILQQLTKKSVL